MNDQGPQRQDEILELLNSLKKRVLRLTVAVILMMLALFALTAAVFGSLVNYYGGDSLLIGFASILFAVVGFIFGWVARRRA